MMTTLWFWSRSTSRRLPSNTAAENPAERKTTKYDGPVSRKYSNKIYIDSWAAATSPSFLVKCVAFKGQLISEWIFGF